MRNETKGMIAYVIGTLIFLYALLFMSGCAPREPSWKMLHRSISAIQRNMDTTHHEAVVVMAVLDENYPESSCRDSMENVVRDLGMANMWMTHVERCANTFETVERHNKKWGEPSMPSNEVRKSN